MHTCPLHWRQGYAEGLANTIPILARRYGNLVRANPFISPVELKRMLEGHGRVVIHYWQAWRLREYILKERYGDWKESFRQVPWLLTRFTVIDPEVQVRLDTLDRCFHRFYVRPSAARHALNYCRPDVALDGTHLISAQKSVLLIAVTIDGNQEILLLAWALVESENKDAWTWFLKLFLEGFPEWAHRDDASIISDRDKGLVPAAREVMPIHIPHYFCAWHLEQNLKRFGKAATAFFWRLGYQTKGMAERLLLASAVEGEDELHLDVVAEGEAVALQGRALAGEVEECPPRAIAEGRGVPDQTSRGLVVEYGECRSVGPPGSRGMPARDGPALQVEGGESRLVGLLEGRGVQEQDGPALEVEGGESRLVGLLEGRGVQEQDGPALEVEGGESRLVGLLEGRGVQEQDGPALEVEGGESRLVGLLEGRWVPEQDGPALEVEGGESRLVGLLEGRGVPEQDGPALEVEGGESRLVGLLEGRWVPEQDGPALEVEGGESRLVGLLEGRGVPEQDGPALEVEGGESRLVGLLEGRWGPEQDGQALEVEGEESRLVMLLEGEDAPEQDVLRLRARRHQSGPRGDVTFGVGLGANFMGGVGSVGRGASPVPSGGDVQRAPASVSDNGLASCSTGDGIGALTTVGNPGARAFDVNTVLRRAREWYRAEDIDTGRTTGTQGSEMGGFTEHFHPASALALPWPDCGQRGNIPAQGPDEPACEDDPVPVDAREDGDEAADGEGEPGIHVRTGFYRNRRGSSYRIGGIMLLHWARLFAVTLRFGIYTSNAAESINSAVRGIRMLPPTWLLASLWDWSRDKWYERKEKARCRDEYLTAAASKRLDQKKQRCQGYWFIGGDNTVGTIQTRGGENEFQWRSFNVNLDARTCECGNWEEYQFPCAHAVAMCILKQRSVEILVSEYYTTRNLRQTYNRDVMGTCVDRLIMEAPLAEVGECDAPALIETRVGRPENHTRFEAPPHAYRCGRCRQYGHNRKRCKYKYGGYGQAQAASLSSLSPPFHSPAALPLSHRLPLSRPFLSLVAFPLSRRLPLSCRLSSLSSPFLSRCPSSLPLPVLTPLPLLLPPPAALAFHHNRLLNALHPPCPPPIARTVARPVSPSNRTYHRMSRRSLFRSLFPFPRSLPPLPVALALSPPFPSPSLSPLPSCRPLSLPSLSVALALSPPFPPPSLSHLPFRRPRSLTSLSVALALSPPFPSPSFSPLPFRRPRSLPSLSVALTLSSHSTNTNDPPISLPFCGFCSRISPFASSFLLHYLSLCSSPDIICFPLLVFLMLSLPP
ncbi:unnamed protein product [Closterium sp. NIES-65]|nr:unnamed protein product [Closterium sp. NIES-65]